MFCEVIFTANCWLIFLPIAGFPTHSLLRKWQKQPVTAWWSRRSRQNCPIRRRRWLSGSSWRSLAVVSRESLTMPAKLRRTAARQPALTQPPITTTSTTSGWTTWHLSVGAATVRVIFPNQVNHTYQSGTKYKKSAGRPQSTPPAPPPSTRRDIPLVDR